MTVAQTSSDSKVLEAALRQRNKLIGQGATRISTTIVWEIEKLPRIVTTARVRIWEVVEE